ncbi:MAG: DEAD/DEAH box helicase [Candidatus Helarchaeota archaeon]
MAQPEQIVKELLGIKGWPELYPAQKLAYNSGLLDTSSNFVIISPTASGKTGIAEMAMLQMLKKGRRVAYLVPLYSLINDKIREFEYLKKYYTIFPNDDSDFGSADIVITTFENFYRKALLRPDIIENFGLVVVDEFHVLYDKLRGFNLEKVLTIIKQFKIRIICLSATFESKEKIAKWLAARVVYIPNEYRAVPLKHNIIDLHKIPEDKQILKLYDILENNNKYPSIIFCHKRYDTQSRAEKFCRYCKDINSPEEIKEKFEKILERTSFTEEESSLLNCMIKGVAFHHSGLNPELRSFIENYFRDMKLKYLFSTTGLAYGINFPAKSVVLYDLDFWNPRTSRREKIPVYMYLQMAGRAGRPQFGDEGFAYVVAKKEEQLEKRVDEYLEGRVEEAICHIGLDDYFRKTILELIYSGRNKDEEIKDFFEKTYYNFLSQEQKVQLVPFNLFETIQSHAMYLYKNDFIFPEGAAGYRLTDLGQVTIKFLFNSIIQYELTPFIKLNKYLENTRRVEHDFNLIYVMFSLFEEIRPQKIARKKSTIIEDFFKKRGIRNVSHAEYSAYATYYGWMENMDEVQIEDRFKVHAHSLASKARELRGLLNVYKSLVEKKHLDIPLEFYVFCDRVYYGVTEEELPFIKKKGIGRQICRNLKNYCKDVLTRPNFNYKGTMLNILISLYNDVGADKFKETHIKYIPDIGPKRAELILSIIEREIETKQ